MQRHVHVDQHGEILGDLAALHQLQQHLDGHQRVVLHQVRQLCRGQADVVHQLGVLLQFGQQLQAQQTANPLNDWFIRCSERPDWFGPNW